MAANYFLFLTFPRGHSVGIRATEHGKVKTELGVYRPSICPTGFRASLLPDPEVNIYMSIE